MRRQQGWLLVEWLLAAVLGMLVLASMTTLLQDALLLARSQRAQGPMQQAAVWLLHRLGDAITLAGQGGVHPLGLDDTRLGAWWPDNDQGPGKAASDQLLLSHVAAQDGMDCEGTRVGAGQQVVERYFLRADSSGPGWVLACDAGLCDAQGCVRLGDAGTALQAEVDSLQVRYLLPGVAGESGAWVEAGDLRQRLPAVPTVLGIRMALLMRGTEMQLRNLRWSTPPEWFGPALSLATDRLPHGLWLMTREIAHATP